jgi:hypothetical protein
MNSMLDNRHIPERRNLIQAVQHDLRALPDRRLNSISVEWIPIDEINLHADLRTVFGNHYKAHNES